MAANCHDQDKRPSKILMTADAVGGVWRYSLDLAAGLAHENVQVLLAVLGPAPSPEQRLEASRFPNVTLTHCDCALEWMSDPWEGVDRSGEWLLDVQKSFEADLIHLNGYSHASLPWSKPVLVVAHSCVYSWWRAVYECAPGSEWLEYRRRVIAGLQAASQIASPSHTMADFLVNEYQISRAKVQVIHNFSFAADLRPREKHPFILAAGRLWDRAKNLALLDRIAPDLDWEVRVAGSASGPEKSVTAKCVRTLGLLEHDELLREMSAAGVFAHPALYEPFGLSVLEAAQAGCALVLSDIPSLRELWDGAAVFVNPRDERAWIAELNALSASPERRGTPAKAASSRALRYAAEDSLPSYLSLCGKMLNRKLKEAAA
ncbi:MAG: glycosyltransferase family 4 protein [Acidobacteriaceae bacterium]|nr:glycosyltransferase family 4 protein [Acidobacteriaceae bacterium]MBV9500092.1 glycosyltransferase family 4 protein [Acidobacteriaceae bacterium]